MKYYLEEGTIDDVKIIYPILESAFLVEELKSEEQVYHLCQSDDYNILLLKSENKLIGFACLCEIKSTKLMWIDYIVICEPFRNKGIGSQFMQLIIENSKGTNGILFEVEIPSSDDKVTHLEQLNRIKYYEKFGARIILENYLLPHKKGAFPMWLFVIPCKDNYYPSEDFTFKSIEFAFDTIHSDIHTRHEVLREIIDMHKKSSSSN